MKAHSIVVRIRLTETEVDIIRKAGLKESRKISTEISHRIRKTLNPVQSIEVPLFAPQGAVMTSARDFAVADTAKAQELARDYSEGVLAMAWRLRMTSDGADLNLGHLKP